MTRKKEKIPEDPPEAPEVEPRLALQRSQWLLLPLMIILPVLALLGLFGERHESTVVQDGPFELTVRYPSVLRYQILDHIEMHVRNQSTAPLDDVMVAMDTTYGRQFSDVVATPEFDKSYQLKLDQLGAGESRLVRIQLKAERYWRHRGMLTVSAGTDTARVRITTMVYP